METASEKQSAGKCLFCNETFAKNVIGRHLSAHLSKLAKEVKPGKPGKSFHLKVEIDSRFGPAPYFLHLWVDGTTILHDIDIFLRQIWLECCGHMSAFTLRKAKKPITRQNRFNADQFLMMLKNFGNDEDEDDDGELSMKEKAKDVFAKGIKIDYEYDFGSTTQLLITVMNEYPVKAPEKIVLMSRNDPPEITCEMCGKEPATQICTVCMYEEENAFCDKCAKKHAKECSDFADYAAMPVVNSPRMAVCGYEGGSIDVERDRVVVKKG